MARHSIAPDPPIGELIAANLVRLGYSEVRVRVQVTKISDLIRAKTGRVLSRQRVSAILNSRRVNPGTVEMIAAAVGVSPDELLRRPEPRRSNRGEG